MARIKPSNNMQAYACILQNVKNGREEWPKSFGKDNIIHLRLNFHIFSVENERD